MPNCQSAESSRVENGEIIHVTANTLASGKLIVGNWKMNGLGASVAEARAIAEGVSALDPAIARAVICPPATLLAAFSNALQGAKLALGGQDCHANASGAHTGDVSAAMLADAGASYVIVGHSERRTNHGETSEMVQAKANAAIAAGLLPIICVGETEAQRDSGQAETVVLDQVLKSLPADCRAEQICIAYEPVWAIGTGRVPSVEDIEAMHGAIRTILVERFGQTDGYHIFILYGGSVNSSNATLLLSILNVNGALVGGASLKAESFLSIVNA
jgi:triosephosphate isomerase (TIM)